MVAQLFAELTDHLEHVHPGVYRFSAAMSGPLTEARYRGEPGIGLVSAPSTA
jgi:hypothetical protein